MSPFFTNCLRLVEPLVFDCSCRMFLFNGVSNGSAAGAALSNLPLFTKGNIRFRNGHVIRVLTEQRQVGQWKMPGST